MKGFVAPTDHGWWRFLRARPELDEVNFWRPGGAFSFSALQPGEPFFFKLKAPYNAIGGFGVFARFARLPVWHAWDAFGQANGASAEAELVQRLRRLAGPHIGSDHQIGCLAIAGPVFFEPDEWVPQPPSWKPQIVSGAAYALERDDGLAMWEACLERAAAKNAAASWTHEAFERQRDGEPQVVVPRLGQASFRLAVMDAYGGACAVTTEHSLPVLDAAHIKPWAAGGEHELRNGMPLRRDLHRLFDLGFVTVRPDGRFAVSPRLREDFSNGRSYYELDGRQVLVPPSTADRPAPELLEWHGDTVFRR